SRCSRSRSANSRMDRLPIRLSRLICSNSSTFDRAIPDLHADDDNDVKITTRVGPLFATTRCPTTSEVTTQTGPILVKNHDPTGASSDDHTQPEIPKSSLRLWTDTRPGMSGGTRKDVAVRASSPARVPGVALLRKH